MTATIQDIVTSTVQFPPEAGQITASTDLYKAGMTSFGSVQLMLALEDAFNIEFPERMLNRRLFSSIATIQAAVEELTLTPAGA
ncbi:MAG: acyl carrier protein [Alphaproteobacteria bacterium]|jgi:acyl carrier protein